ncbi:uncharacterized protein [Eucyclogobius newberryi]|uniref:uncharacterized protein n=1 Tax=Eucyclogobius newberryi TaxID=166745 RepID=UPI003B5AADB0
MMVLLLSALFLLMCLVLLSSLCVHCNRRPMASIRQTHTSEDTYIPSTLFLTHRPTQYSNDQNYVHPQSNFLSPPFSDERTQRRACPSLTPTETESNNSYENADVCGRVNDEEDDVPDPGYIVVLPETAPPVAINSRASSLSSGSNNVYENTEDDDDDDEHNYVNVGESKNCISQSHHCKRSTDQQTANHSQDSSESSDSDDDDDSDDDEDDYVNQPTKAEEPSA